MAPGPAIDLLKGPLAAVLTQAETRLGHALALEAGEKLEIFER